MVLACGPVSHLNREFGLSENREFMLGLGAKMGKEDSSEVMEFHTKGELEGGYGYYFPRGSEVNVGLCCPHPPPEVAIRRADRGFARRRDAQVVAHTRPAARYADSRPGFEQRVQDACSRRLS